jgi:hypothetical protein
MGGYPENSIIAITGIKVLTATEREGVLSSKRRAYIRKYAEILGQSTGLHGCF